MNKIWLSVLKCKIHIKKEDEAFHFWGTLPFDISNADRTISADWTKKKTNSVIYMGFNVVNKWLSFAFDSNARTLCFEHPFCFHKSKGDEKRKSTKIRYINTSSVNWSRKSFENLWTIWKHINNNFFQFSIELNCTKQNSMSKTTNHIRKIERSELNEMLTLIFHRWLEFVS